MCNIFLNCQNDYDKKSIHFCLIKHLGFFLIIKYQNYAGAT